MKIISPDNLAQLCERLHKEGGVIVFGYGTFDLLHPGHINFLREGRNLGSHLLVALDSDESHSLISLEERMEVLAAMEMVHYVTWFDQETPENMIREIKPDVVLKSADELNEPGTSNIVEKIVKLPL